MKRSGFDHPKLKRLCRLLGIDHSYAVGIVESIWQFTAKHAPRGDIGKWTDEEITEAIDCTQCASAALVDALVEARLLDRVEDFRLLVHDWDEHCEDSVHLSLARKITHFANGNRPKLTRLSKAERPEIEAAFEDKERTARNGNAHQTHDVCTPCDSEHTKTRAQPSRSPAKPLPKPGPAKPEKTGRPGTGVFEGLETGTLRDDRALAQWQANAAQRANPVISDSEHDRLRVFSAAERALEHGDNPVALFASIVSSASWTLITQAQEDRASVRLKKHDAHTRGGGGHLAVELDSDSATENDSRRMQSSEVIAKEFAAALRIDWTKLDGGDREEILRLSDVLRRQPAHKTTLLGLAQDLGSRYRGPNPPKKPIVAYLVADAFGILQTAGVECPANAIPP